MTTTLDIVGCGRVGRSLGRLWHQTGTFEIGCILNRSAASGRAAAAFIGAGLAVDSPALLGDADLLLIAAADDAIAGCCRSLVESQAVRPGSSVFHCSGALSSEVLTPAREAGASVASVHPVKSFADPSLACRSFAETHCGMEGDAIALERLRPAFEAIGARLFEVNPRFKTIYHAGAVIACNYLVSLVEAGLRCYEKAGVPRATAEEILQPLISGTVENVFRQGTAGALTGPIARGEESVVARQLGALAEWSPQLASLYRVLGLTTLEIARAQGGADPESLAALRRLLEP